MNIKPLKIGELIAELPIVQGGMGVGISRSRLAAAVANEGGVGIISTAQIGFDEEDFSENPLKANIRALAKHIKKAKESAKKGIIGINIMVALTNYETYVKTAIQSGIDLIISGAGLPTMLPKLVENTKVKIAPIVSSFKAVKTILKVWDRKYNRSADMVVIEGPRAGGHLGYSVEDIQAGVITLDTLLPEIKEEVSRYEVKYNKHIPIVVAGGIFDGHDISHYLELGANGVQIATRFITTDECDASLAYKEAFINCKQEDIEIVKSPVGMPGRAIRNHLVDVIKTENVKVKKCLNCLKIEHCDRKNIPYCITEKLIEAVNGDTVNGLLFCGDNAYRLNKIDSVHNLIKEIKNEML